MQGDVTRLLQRWHEGDQTALAKLTPLVYAELLRLGGRALRQQRRESQLQPTALVHEAWLKLAGKERFSAVNRGQFYVLAAKIMRDILVDHLRRRRASKRGGSQVRITLAGIDALANAPVVDFLILDEAMTRLSAIKPRYGQIVELRYLVGLTIEETATTLHVSHATIEREWTFARAWLRRELCPAPASTSSTPFPVTER
jgi:RNA polymerase sigma factor (TIGR02999 family)